MASDPLKRPMEGDVLLLMDEEDGGREVEVIVGESRGWAELHVVFSPDWSKSGLIATKPNGDWYWVRPLEPPPKEFDV